MLSLFHCGGKRRLQRLHVPHQDPFLRRHHHHAAPAHVPDQRSGRRHDRFLQPVQEHRVVLSHEKMDITCICFQLRDLANDDVITRIRSDLAGIGGSFRSGILKFTGNVAVSKIMKIASIFLQIGSDEEECALNDVVGVTKEVVAFARSIAMHLETWLDFPLPDDDPSSDDFDLSDAQQEHALTVECLAPRLGSLRLELFPGYMGDA